MSGRKINAICPAFQRGSCQLGDKCPLIHFGISEKLRSDAENVLKSKMWPMSSYGPFAGKPSLANFKEQSPEQLRLQHYFKNNQDPPLRFKDVRKEAENNFKELLEPKPSHIEACLNIYNHNLTSPISVSVVDDTDDIKLDSDESFELVSVVSNQDAIREENWDMIDVEVKKPHTESDFSNKEDNSNDSFEIIQELLIEDLTDGEDEETKKEAPINVKTQIDEHANLTLKLQEYVANSNRKDSSKNFTNISKISTSMETIELATDAAAAGAHAKIIKQQHDAVAVTHVLNNKTSVQEQQKPQQQPQGGVMPKLWQQPATHARRRIETSVSALLQPSIFSDSKRKFTQRRTQCEENKPLPFIFGLPSVEPRLMGISPILEKVKNCDKVSQPGEQESLRRMLESYGIMWRGGMKFNGHLYPIQMYFLSGNKHIARTSLPSNYNGSLPIFEATTCLPSNVEKNFLNKKLQNQTDHCMLLALPFEYNGTDSILGKSRSLQMACLFTYLQNDSTGAYIYLPFRDAATADNNKCSGGVHFIPQFEYTNECIKAAEPMLEEYFVKYAHFLMIISTGCKADVCKCW